MTQHFKDDSFQQEVLEVSKTKPVLVDFFAPWCGPCKMQDPIIDEVAEELKDKAIIGKLNTEEEVKTAASYNVTSIPTLIVFKDGKEQETLNGLQPKETLIETINKYL